MKITSDNIDEIKRRYQYLCDNFNIEEAEEDDFEIDEEGIYIRFPEEFNEEPLPLDDFLWYTDDIETLKEVDDSTVRTDRVRQTIIHFDEYKLANFNIYDYYIDTNSYSLGFGEYPFYIGLIASKNHIYSEDYSIYPYSSYKVVELRYKDNACRLAPSEEDKLIKQFLFEVSSKFNLSIRIGTFLDWYDWYDEEEVKTEPDEYNLADRLNPYSSVMDMYLESLSIENMEIQFVYFYKIIEYFSAVVGKKKAYELLNDKLDELSKVKRDYRYFESIFALSRKYDRSIKDKELANTVISECIDIVQLYPLLPVSIRKSLEKSADFQEIDSIRKEQKTAVIRKISDILYATRNSFVHAKSNYNPTGDECKLENLEQMNIFMSKLCYYLIVWNGKQEEAFRM